MAKKQLSFMLVLAVIAGFIGGLIYNQVFKEKDVFASEEKTFEAVYSKKFILVNESGKPIGAFSSGEKEGNPFLRMDAPNKSFTILHHTIPCQVLL